MRKKAVFISMAVVACVLCLGVGIAYAADAMGGNDFFLAGGFFQSARNETSLNTSSGGTIVAKYNGEAITAATVAYQKNMNILRNDEAAAKNDTDIEIINNIIESMILYEEAVRQGFAATEEEVDALMQNAARAYEIPEGKEMLDAFCKGAGITIEEYFEIYREQLPRTIARQKLKDEIGRQYCEEHGLEFTKTNPPAEMVEAQRAYVADLFEKNKDKIEYFIDSNA